jgi:hypothetical protein
MKDMKEMQAMNVGQYRQGLAEVFSGYRAEWLGKEIFELFTEPSYFPQLTTSHPCFLVGGRGTGKTTALRCLSYTGQEALRSGSEVDSALWPYFGMYYRVNTNRVRAFSGSEIAESRWIQLFAHYVNMEFCELVLRFLEWYASRHPDAPTLGTDSVAGIGAALQLDNVETQSQLAHRLKMVRLRFEAAINNIVDAEKLPPLSMQAAPIDEMLKEVKGLPQFADKTFFFLVDEYENLDDQQQRVLNTLIKHCGALYSFKVSVRELGFRERSTLNEREALVHPADFKMINIADELEGRFEEFASRVCGQRLQHVLGTSMDVPDPHELFPELSAEDEAVQLGVNREVTAVLQDLRKGSETSPDLSGWISKLHPLEVYTANCRASAEGLTTMEKLRSAWNNQNKWREQYDNYKHAYLFSIRRGKRGIRKYFAGWRVFCLLAAGNIRYLLELVDQALTNHLDEGGGPSDPVSPKTQTEAAQAAGRKNLRELEGLSLDGAKLTRLLLGLGRVFQVMAEDPVGHTPEVNQFHLSADIVSVETRDRVTGLVADGIMHLALLRYAGSKLQEQSDIRQSDYALHPIFAPFFGFSHRRKRKVELTDQDICDLVENPSETIRGILHRQNRSVENDLPEQMELFAEFYALPR